MIPFQLCGISHLHWKVRMDKLYEWGISDKLNSGKSSLLACIFSLATITSGEIYIDGIDISTVPKEKLHSALVPISQNPKIPWFFPVLFAKIFPWEYHQRLMTRRWFLSWRESKFGIRFVTMVAWVRALIQLICQMDKNRSSALPVLFYHLVELSSWMSLRAGLMSTPRD